MDRRTPGLPVHHQLPEFIQTHVHQVRDAIQPCHPLTSPPLLPSTLPSIRVPQDESVLCIRWPKYWSFSFSISPSNAYSGFTSLRIDWYDLLAKGLSRVFPASQFGKINFLVLSLLYGPTLTSIHDYWKNHSFDYTDLC